MNQENTSLSRKRSIHNHVVDKTQTSSTADLRCTQNLIDCTNKDDQILTTSENIVNTEPSLETQREKESRTQFGRDRLVAQSTMEDIEFDSDDLNEENEPYEANQDYERNRTQNHRKTPHKTWSWVWKYATKQLIKNQLTDLNEQRAKCNRCEWSILVKSGGITRAVATHLSSHGIFSPIMDQTRRTTMNIDNAND